MPGLRLNAGAQTESRRPSREYLSQRWMPQTNASSHRRGLRRKTRSARRQLIPSVAHAQGQAPPIRVDNIPVHHRAPLDTGLNHSFGRFRCRRIIQVGGADRQNYSQNDPQKYAHVHHPSQGAFHEQRHGKDKRTDIVMVPERLASLTMTPDAFSMGSEISKRSSRVSQTRTKSRRQQLPPSVRCRPIRKKQVPAWR
jgi:hypothetical protein